MPEPFILLLSANSTQNAEDVLRRTRLSSNQAAGTTYDYGQAVVVGPKGWCFCCWRQSKVLAVRKPATPLGFSAPSTKSHSAMSTDRHHPASCELGALLQ